MMKQIKSNNWLDLLVRFLLASDWFRVGVLSEQEIRPGDFHLRSATKPVQEGKRGTFPPEDDGSFACLGFFLYTITCYH